MPGSDFLHPDGIPLSLTQWYIPVYKGYNQLHTTVFISIEQYTESYHPTDLIQISWIPGSQYHQTPDLVSHFLHPDVSYYLSSSSIYLCTRAPTACILLYSPLHSNTQTSSISRISSRYTEPSIWGSEDLRIWGSRDLYPHFWPPRSGAVALYIHITSCGRT